MKISDFYFSYQYIPYFLYVASKRIRLSRTGAVAVERKICATPIKLKELEFRLPEAFAPT
jgi:hypothetical protein